jgi:CheY-like chemotaxis protein
MGAKVDADKGRVAETETRADDRGSTARRILVVDDNPDTADMTQLLLQIRGHVVRAAYDGRSALEVVATFRPELVLLDIGLPGLDGYELAKKLRQVPNARDAVLVALTGWGEPAHWVARAHEDGFVAHLTKPFDLSAVLDLIAAAPRLGDVPARA